MRGSARLGWVVVCGFVGVVVMTAACSPASRARSSAGVLDDRDITVASFDFPESRLLADLYATALRRRGLRVHLASGLGPRELVDPALSRGLVELVPEYAGTALAFLSLGASHPSADVAATHAGLDAALASGRLSVLAPAPAQNANAIVVTRATAAEHGLRTISDLAAVAPTLTFGGPPECPSRPFCLEGLRRVYGLRFDAFLALDAGGPITRSALASGDVDVALLFTTDPAITRDDLVVLTDDRALQPAENVTPLVNRAAVERFGPALVDTVDAVSARLTTDELRTLNGRVAIGERREKVARDWVRRQVPA